MNPLDRVEHRPWPLPSTPWIMRQSWCELLFAHWSLAAEVLRPHIPPPLVLDEYEGQAWLGLTPFRLEGLRPRWLPALPGLSEFPEMNLRTYVRHRGRAGIFFFSLDAGSQLAVLGARAGFRLPYFKAQMESRRDGDGISYRSRRVGSSAEFVGRYRPVGPVFEASPGTLDHFLVERYALFTVLSAGKVLEGDIHHIPWRISEAEAEIERNTVPEAHGVALPLHAPRLHYAARQDTLIWPPAIR